MTARFWNTNPRRSAASKRPSGIANILLPRHTTLIDAKIGFWSFSAVCLLLVSTVSLTGCTTIFQQVNNKSNSESNGIEAGTMTLGEKLEAGTGTFDRNDPSFQLFDPCVEISAEQYAELGYEVNEASYQTQTNNPMSVCGLLPIDAQSAPGSVVIATDVWTTEFLEEKGFLISNLDIDLPKGMYLHDLAGDAPVNNCNAAIVTVGGRLSIGYVYFPRFSPTKEQACQQAIDILTSVLNLEVQN